MSSSLSLDWNKVLHGLHPLCMRTVQSLKFGRATPVQANTIQHFAHCKDVVVDACTGSGKTLSFLIPMFDILLRLDDDTLRPWDCGALIIAPTRELSHQIAEVAKQFDRTQHSLSLALITGGIRSHADDLKLIQKGCNIVIGTPGRIWQCISNGYLNCKKLEVLIMDEADRLLSMGFEQQINHILSALPKQRRTGLFSATQSSDVRQLIRVGLRNPISIALKIAHKSMQTQCTPKSLRNRFVMVKEGQEMLCLLHVMHKFGVVDKQKMMVFALTCAQIDYLKCVLPMLLSANDTGIKMWFMHGRLPQKTRTRIYETFLKTQQGILLCTDVVARGIDIPDVDIIVQFDPPQKTEFFVHRVGRTARMGKSGHSIVMLREHEKDYLQLLKIRKVPITKQISVEALMQENTALSFEVGSVDAFIEEEEEDEDVETAKTPKTIATETHALQQRLRQFLASDRENLDKANRAFVSFIEAYNNHECKYIFRTNQLNAGRIANGMGLLYLPKMKRIEIDTADFESPRDIEFAAIAYKNPQKEKQRMNKLQKIQERKLEREQKRKEREVEIEKEKQEKKTDESSEKTKKQRKKPVGNKKKKRKMIVDDKGHPALKKQKRMPHKMRELQHYQKEEVLLKRVKKGLLSQNEFEKAMGYKMNAI